MGLGDAQLLQDGSPPPRCAHPTLPTSLGPASSSGMPWLRASHRQSGGGGQGQGANLQPTSPLTWHPFLPSRLCKCPCPTPLPSLPSPCYTLGTLGPSMICDAV